MLLFLIFDCNIFKKATENQAHYTFYVALKQVTSLIELLRQRRETVSVSSEASFLPQILAAH